MGRALIAVGTVLALCFAIFGGVVFFTRDEDRVAVDNLLAEQISRAIGEAERRGEQVDFRTLTDFDWDEVVVYEPGTPRSVISDALGFEFRGDLRYDAESKEVFVFTNRGAFVRFADYRGPGRFESFSRPVDRLAANDAVFSVEDGVARVAG